jgi:hypothetical protein
MTWPRRWEDRRTPELTRRPRLAKTPSHAPGAMKNPDVPPRGSGRVQCVVGRPPLVETRARGKCDPTGTAPPCAPTLERRWVWWDAALLLEEQVCGSRGRSARPCGEDRVLTEWGQHDTFSTCAAHPAFQRWSSGAPPT